MRYRLLVIGAWLSLLWERAWPAFFPPAALGGVLIALALLGFWAALPAGLAAAALAFYLAAMSVALVAGLWSVRLPRHRDVLHWLETRNALLHRPVSAADDEPATPLSPESAALWERHREEARAGRQSLKAPLPRPGVARRDPWGLRIGVGLVLIVAVIAGGRNWQESLTALFTPPLMQWHSAPELTAWLDPPEYTGRPPVTLSAAAPAAETEAISVPQGTVLHARASGTGRTPLLHVADTERAFSPDGGDSHAVTATIETSGRYTVTAGGRKLAEWGITAETDAPPSIAFVNEPRATARKSLVLEYRAEDDHSLEKGEVRIYKGGRRNGETLALPLPLPGADDGTVEATTYENLTAHPWSGTKVMARLAVTDARGQEGVSAPVTFTLPERSFSNPVARELIDLRRLLAADPATGPHVARRLGRLTLHPERFNHDIVSYLAIRTAAFRVTEDDETVDEMVDLLWDTALRIEDGALSMAERDMRSKLDSLLKTLAQKATGEAGLSRQIGALRRSLGQYLNAARNSGHGGQAPPTMSSGQGQRVITSKMLMDMVDRIQQLTEVGAMAAARNLLSDLRTILENMTVAGRGAAGAAEATAARRELGRLRRDQQRLMDATYQRALDAGAAPSPLSQRQQSLQAALKAAAGKMETMTDAAAGRALKAAGAAMARARQALGNGAYDKALSAQGAAIDALAEAEGALARAMSAAPGGRSTPGGPGSRFGDDGGPGIVPKAGEIKRAQEILRELRQRAGERRRPEIERQYLERLLDRF